MILSQEDGGLRLVPGEVVPKRRIRKIDRRELAQALLDGADTPSGLTDACQAIAELGFDPGEFKRTART